MKKFNFFKVITIFTFFSFIGVAHLVAAEKTSDFGEEASYSVNLIWINQPKDKLANCPGQKTIFPEAMSAIVGESVRGWLSSERAKVFFWFDLAFSTEDQVNRAFKNLDRVLAEAGTDKRRLISVTVMLNDIENKPLMDEVWANWIGKDPSNWPERSCFGVNLHAGNCIELRAVAVRNELTT